MRRPFRRALASSGPRSTFQHAWALLGNVYIRIGRAPTAGKVIWPVHAPRRRGLWDQFLVRTSNVKSLSANVDYRRSQQKYTVDCGAQHSSATTVDGSAIRAALASPRTNAVVNAGISLLAASTTDTGQHLFR